MTLSTQEIVARALDALPELLDRKLESDSYASHGESSAYTDEDREQMALETNAAGALAQQLNEGGRVVVLSAEAYAMVCGLVAPTEQDDQVPVAEWRRSGGALPPPAGVWHQGVFGPIEEVQRAFPILDFWAAVNDGTIEYDEEAGT